MKILGVRGNLSLLKSFQQSAIQKSTKYEDRFLIAGTNEDKIKLLKRNLNTEITIASPYILTLEELSSRYYDDGVKADYEDNYGYCIAYRIAYEKSVNIAINFYNCLPLPI